jgi:hypothetical protein
MHPRGVVYIGVSAAVDVENDDNSYWHLTWVCDTDVNFSLLILCVVIRY